MSRKDISDLQVLQAYVDAKALRDSGVERWPYDLLQERTGQCYKVCYAAMDRADDRGLINFGVSLRTGWLTEKGVIMHAMLTDN